MLVIAGASFWGLGGTVAQRLFQDYSISVDWLVSTRLLIAGVLLLAIQFLLKDRMQVFDVWRNKFASVRLVIFGLFGTLAVQYTFMASINYGNAAVATLLQYLAPVMIIFYLLLRRQTIFTRQDVVIVILALGGCFLLLTNGSLAGLSVPFNAVVWGVLSAVALAFYTLYAIPLLKQYDSLVVVGWAMTVGGAAMSLIHPPWEVNLAGMPLEGYLYLAFVIVFGTMLAFWFYIESLQSLSPKETSLLSSLEPLVAVVATVFWLQEPFGLFQWGGAASIIGMIVILALSKPKVSAEVPRKKRRLFGSRP